MAATTAAILPLACVLGIVLAATRPFGGDGFVGVIAVLAAAGLALLCTGLLWARRR